MRASCDRKHEKLLQEGQSGALNPITYIITCSELARGGWWSIEEAGQLMLSALSVEERKSQPSVMTKTNHILCIVSHLCKEFQFNINP